MIGESHIEKGVESAAVISRRRLLRGIATGAAAVGLGVVAGPAGATVLPAGRARHLRPGSLEKAIGFSQPYTAAASWQPLMLAAQAQAAKQGFLLLESHANSELNAQLAEIEEWIEAGIAGIIVLPLAVNPVESLVSKAHAKGIKVLDYSDSSLSHADGWVIFNNAQGAQDVGTYAGRWVNKTLGGQAKVALLTNNGELTGRQRTQGSLAALQKIAPGAKLVAQAPGVLSSQTLGPARSMLQANPDINVFICAADEGCAGVLEAFEGTHPSAQRQNEMFICGFDGSVPVIKQVLAGTPIRATGALEAVAIGKACVNATISALQDKSSGRRQTFPYILVDAQAQAVGQALVKKLSAQ
ncbi:MAG: sugar ABC transporter substrate-binding protein [Acidimicrobiales bacterium]|jgi:ribose transport system substrate-binding protein